MFAQDDIGTCKTDIFRHYDLVGGPFFQNSILMDARLMAERIMPDNSFIGCDNHTGQFAYQPGHFTDLRRIDLRRNPGIQVLARAHTHNDPNLHRCRSGV